MTCIIGKFWSKLHKKMKITLTSHFIGHIQ